MPTIWNHGMKNDWCHVCGNRSDETADVWYPQNAEHATKMQHQNTKSSAKYVRICRDCATKILDATKATQTNAKLTCGIIWHGFLRVLQKP